MSTPYTESPSLLLRIFPPKKIPQLPPLTIMKRRSIKRFYVALSVDFGHIIFFLSFYIFHSAKIFEKPSTRDYNLFPSPLLQISDTFGQCVFSG